MAIMANKICQRMVMEIESLYYFTELAKDLHYRKTAERLFISHQTLSNHIKRLEEFYGVPLFTRTPHLSLTYAGEKLLDYAQTTVVKNALLKSLFSDIKGEEKGAISFGASRLRLSGCIPEILPKFLERFPYVETRLIAQNSDDLIKLLQENKLDFIMATSSVNDTQLEETTLINDQVFLCVSDGLLEKNVPVSINTNGLVVNEHNLSLFADLPFFFLNTTLGQQVHSLFQKIGIMPKIISTIDYTQLVIDLCFKGVAASFVPRAAIADSKMPIPADVHLFPVYNGDRPIFQSLNLISRKDKYYPSYAIYLMRLIENHYKRIDSFSDMLPQN